jgi:hypothetical protein
MPAACGHFLWAFGFAAVLEMAWMIDRGDPPVLNA